jgi:hypothetical protein
MSVVIFLWWINCARTCQSDEVAVIAHKSGACTKSVVFTSYNSSFVPGYVNVQRAEMATAINNNHGTYVSFVNKALPRKLA